MKRTIITILHNELFGGLIVVLIFLLLLLTSCASTSNDLTQAALLRQASTQAPETDSRNSSLIQKIGETRKNHSSSDYKVGPEDLLEIDVFQVPELKTVARVSARGYIKLSLIDEVKAEGLSVSELESFIAAKLAKYLQEPTVSIFVKEYRSQQISVLGAVKNPQVFYVSGQKYLLDMLSMSGGLAPEAGSLCIVQTMSGVLMKNGPPDKIVIDLDALLLAGRVELNIPVNAGDVIQVPKKDSIVVSGAVVGAGEIQITKKTTLTEAIGMAKGFKYEASRSDIKIYRDTGNSQREVITVDYNAVLEAKTPDPVLRDKDLIIISESGFKTFLKGFVGTLNFGIFRLGTAGL